MILSTFAASLEDEHFWWEMTRGEADDLSRQFAEEGDRFARERFEADLADLADD